MYWNRWIVFIACAFLQASAGLNYSFSVFAPALKAIFHLDEVQLGCVATLGFNLGGYLAIISGTIYDALGSKNHIGPRAVAITGAVLLFIGYFGIYSLATGLLPYSYALLMLFALVAGNSGCWFDTTALTTCMTNYPDDRGTVVGILKSFLGLTATIYTSIFLAVFQPNILGFILFLALCPSSLALVLTVFINKVPLEYHLEDPQPATTTPASATGTIPPTPPAPPRHESRISKEVRFAVVYFVVAVVALAGMITAIWSSKHHLESTGRKVIISVLVGVLALLLLVPLSAGPCTHPRRRHRLKVRYAAAAAADGGGDRAAPLLQHSAAPDVQQPCLERGKSLDDADKVLRRADLLPDDEDEDDMPPARELTSLQAARTLEFWFIFAQALIGLGTGLAFLNNITGLVIALGGSVGGQVVFVSLFSVANASGRLTFGYVSEHFMHRHGTRRTLFLVLISALMTAFSASMCFSTLPDLYAMALLGGFAFGGHWAIIPSVLADLFGIKHFASTYTVVQFAPAAGGYLLATVLVGMLYEAAKAASPSRADEYCVGHGCYGTTWQILTCVNAVSLLCTRQLWVMSRAAYEGMRRH